MLSSATFQVNVHAVRFICCDLQMMYDQSFCYLCVVAGNACLHIIFVKSYAHGNQSFVRKIVIIHTFVFCLVLLTQCIRPFI